MASNDPTTAHRTRRGLLLAVAAIALSLAAPWVYVALMKSPFIRSTGLPAFGIMGVASIMGIVAARRDRRIAVRLLGWTNPVMFLAFAGAFFIWSALPPSESFAALDHAPDFTLNDQAGEPVSLKDALASGPVHLVFYRGWW